MAAQRPRIRLLVGESIALGPGKAALLDAIGGSGSLSAAARRMGMSYRRAWSLVQAMNGDFREPLVELSTGGRGGGGARLTALGQEALRRYRDLEAEADAAVARSLEAFAPLLKSPSAGDGQKV